MDLVDIVHLQMDFVVVVAGLLQVRKDLVLVELGELAVGLVELVHLQMDWSPDL